MTRYPGQVPPTRLAAGILVIAASVSGIVLLSYLLTPNARSGPAVADAVKQAGSQAGIVECPTVAELPARDPVPVSSGLLIDCPWTFDGDLVSYEGEVIDAVLHRGDRAWVQLNDDVYSGNVGPLPQHRNALGGNSGIAVSIPETAAENIRFAGGHDAQGDRLHVVGVFRRADPADGGGPTIHGLQVTINRSGHAIRHTLSRRLVGSATAAGLLTIAAFTVHVRRKGSRYATRH